MAEKSPTWPWPAWGISIGAGLGVLVGALVGGGDRLALGVVVGAAVGLVAGAAVDGIVRRRR